MDNYDEVRRSNMVYELSGEDFNPFPEVDSDETEGDEINNDDDDSSSTSTDNDEGDHMHNNEAIDTQGHIPSASWFESEEITHNNLTNSSGVFSNINPIGDDLFQGQCFADKQTALDTIKAWHIKQSRNYRVLKSDTMLYEANCVVAECPWRIRVIKRKRPGYFEITKLPSEHNCLLRTLQRDHKKLSSRLIANAIKQQLQEGVARKATSIIKNVWRLDDFLFKASDVLSALMHFNSSTSASIEAVDDDTNPNVSVCKRVWWSFKPMADGWQHARPVISIDGTFLKGRYNGKLLIAMGFDSNYQQYPLAYGVVNEETTANWSWFLRRL